MASIKCSEIFSRFYTKVEAYDILALSDEIRNEYLCGYLHSSISKPYTDRLFSSITITDPYYDEGVFVDGDLTYELKNKIDDSKDTEFVSELFGIGVALAWSEGKANSEVNMRQLIGTSAEKFYSQSAHSSGVQSIRDNLELAQRNLIRDRGAAYNAYLKNLKKSDS